MHEFVSGSQHTATLPIAVSPSGLACTAELYLVKDSTSYSLVQKSFTSTGAMQTLAFPTVTMPEAGVYAVYIDMYSGGSLIAAYEATEGVTVTGEAPPPAYGLRLLDYYWQDEPSNYPPGMDRAVTTTIRYECTIPNTMGTFQVVLKANGSVVCVSETRTADITGYGQETMTFTITTPSDGSYPAYIRGYVSGDLVYEESLGTVTVITQSTPFSYSAVACCSGPQANPNYCWLGFDCDITNPQGVEITQNVILYNRRDDGLLMTLETSQVTLGPGASVHYQFRGSNCSHLYIHQQTLWAEDEGAGKSSSCHP